MVGTIDIKVTAANPNMPLKTLFVFVNSPSSVRIIDVPKKIGNWRITKVYVAYNYPDNVSDRKECVLTGGCYVGTIPASTKTGKSVNGYAIVADGIDEDGNDVTGYVLGKGDICVLDADGRIVIDGKTVYLHLLAEMPEDPKDGDVIFANGKWKIWQNGGWTDFGSSDVAWGNITGDMTNQQDLQQAFDNIGSKLEQAEDSIRTLQSNVTDNTSQIGQIFNDIAPTYPSTEAYENALAGAKATAEFVNSSINNFAAFYITKDAAGNAFATKAELLGATVFYSGGQVRVPTKNDYCIVLADESHPTALTNPTTRYTYNSQWEFQYVVNNTSLTQAQINAINSGITSAKVQKIDTIPTKVSDLSNDIGYALSSWVNDNYESNTTLQGYSDTLLSGMTEDGSEVSFYILTKASN